VPKVYLHILTLNFPKIFKILPPTLIFFEHVPAPVPKIISKSLQLPSFPLIEFLNAVFTDSREHSHETFPSFDFVFKVLVFVSLMPHFFISTFKALLNFELSDVPFFAETITILLFMLVATIS
jgi:hypothetical protein